MKTRTDVFRELHLDHVVLLTGPLDDLARRLPCTADTTRTAGELEAYAADKATQACDVCRALSTQINELASPTSNKLRDGLLRCCGQAAAGTTPTQRRRQDSTQNPKIIRGEVREL